MVGDKTKRDKFLEQFIKEHDIVAFNIYRQTGRIKIAQIREIKKYTSFKKNKDSCALVILEGELTADAQNAFLKTLEEPSPYLSIVLSVDSKERILPTVASRCKVIDFGITPGFVENKLLENIFLDLGKNRNFFDAAITSCEKIIGNNESEAKKILDEIILTLRKMLLEHAIDKKNLDDKSFFVLFNLLEKFVGLYPLVVSNNVNLRFAIENVILGGFLPLTKD